MRFERIQLGKYRAQLVRPGDYLWVVREAPRKWAWYIGGYSGYDHRAEWAAGNKKLFRTMKEAIADAIRSYTF